MRSQQHVSTELTYEEKVKASELRVKTAIEEYGHECAVGCSFGKDSMAVLHMAMKYDPTVLAVWCNTGVEGPLTERFAHECTESMGINIYEARPKRGITFWTITEKYGWPSVRLSGKRKEKRIPACCIHLKDNPARDAYAMFGSRLLMTGVTAPESRNRWLVMKRNSNAAIASGIDPLDPAGRGAGARYALKNGTERLNPIIEWTVDDVFRYSEENGIPMHPIYSKDRSFRVGCLPCTSYISWKDTLAKTDPKMLKFILERKEGQLQITDLCRWAGVIE